MKYNDIVYELFSSIDDRNVQTFLTFLSENCLFRFSNNPPVTGKEKVGRFVSAFFDSISSLEHKIEDAWEIGDGIVCHGIVSYTRHNKTVLSVPFSNIFKFDNGYISEYLIFVDSSDL